MIPSQLNRSMDVQSTGLRSSLELVCNIGTSVTFVTGEELLELLSEFFVGFEVMLIDCNEQLGKHVSRGGP